MVPSPNVVIVGGPDVDARLDLMDCLKDNFNIRAIGSQQQLQSRFAAAGYGYNTYRLSRRANPLVDLSGLSQLVAYFRELRPQIVHTFATKPGVWGRLAAHLAGVPIIIGTLPGLGSLYADDTTKTRLIRAMYQPLQKIACSLSDMTIFQNHDDARQFTSAGVVSPEKSRVIRGSGVATDLFDPRHIPEATRANLRAELGIHPHNLVVTMVSRVTRLKGVLEFMTAAKQIKAVHPNVQFLLVGPQDDGVDRLNANELAQLKQTVIWPGLRRDIPTVLACSDIFVLPSTYREGIPRVLLEAASMKLPLITTDSPGCNEVVKSDTNGFLVPPHNQTALNQAISTLVERAELRTSFGQASRNRAIEHFDLSVIAEQTQSVYEHLLTQKTNFYM